LDRETTGRVDNLVRCAFFDEILHSRMPIGSHTNGSSLECSLPYRLTL
jgi:hypothetical protein